MARGRKIMKGPAIRDTLDGFMFLCLIGILGSGWIGFPVESWRDVGAVGGLAAIAAICGGLLARNFIRRE